MTSTLEQFNLPEYDDDQKAAIAKVKPLETGSVINDRYNRSEYVERRVHFLNQLPEYDMVGKLFPAVHLDADRIYSSPFQKLSVQQVRAAEILAKIDTLLPLPTTVNMSSLDSYAAYPTIEWTDGLGASPALRGISPAKSPSSPSFSDVTPDRDVSPIDPLASQKLPEASHELIMSIISRLGESSAALVASTAPSTDIRTVTFVNFPLNLFASPINSTTPNPESADEPVEQFQTTVTPAGTSQAANSDTEAPKAPSEAHEDGRTEDESCKGESTKDELSKNKASKDQSSKAAIAIPSDTIDQSRGSVTTASSSLPGQISTTLAAPSRSASAHQYFDTKDASELPAPVTRSRGIAQPVGVNRGANRVPKSRGSAQHTIQRPNSSISPTHELVASNPLSPIISGAESAHTKKQAFDAQALLIARLRARDQDAFAFLPEFHCLPANKPKQDDDQRACVCGSAAEPARGIWIACDGCFVWQHTICMAAGVPDDIEGGMYLCQVCDPWVHRERLQAIRKKNAADQKTAEEKERGEKMARKRPFDDEDTGVDVKREKHVYEG